MTGACLVGERLAVRVGAFEPAEITAVANANTRDKKSHFQGFLPGRTHALLSQGCRRVQHDQRKI